MRRTPCSGKRQGGFDPWLFCLACSALRRQQPAGFPASQSGSQHVHSSKPAAKHSVPCLARQQATGTSCTQEWAEDTPWWWGIEDGVHQGCKRELRGEGRSVLRNVERDINTSTEKAQQAPENLSLLMNSILHLRSLSSPLYGSYPWKRHNSCVR